MVLFSISHIHITTNLPCSVVLESCLPTHHHSMCSPLCYCICIECPFMPNSFCVNKKISPRCQVLFTFCSLRYCSPGTGILCMHLVLCLISLPIIVILILYDHPTVVCTVTPDNHLMCPWSIILSLNNYCRPY